MNQSYADFAAAGQDAFAMVGLIYRTPHIEGRELMTVICQVSMWPPRTDIYLKDAAAIKVRDTLSRIGCIRSFVCRRWQVLAPNFPNLSNYIRPC